MRSELVGSLRAKIFEQLDLVEQLFAATPDTPEWRAPYANSWPVSTLIGHLLECMAGFCAVLAAAEPERLQHFAELRATPPDFEPTRAFAVRRIGHYRAAIAEGFALLSDKDLSRKLPTVFVPRGETILTLFLGNLEHLINHKCQLFVYCKLMGVDLGTKDLYRFREASD